MDRLLRAEATDGHAQMARAAAVLFGIAAVVNLLGVVLPHQPGIDVPGYIVVTVVAAALSVVFAVGGARLPDWVFQAACLAGTLLVSLGLWSNGERHGGAAGGDEIYYAWVVLYVAYFMGRRATALHAALACAVYAVTLAGMQVGPVAVSRWITVTGMIAGAAVVVRVLRERADGLLSALREAALTDHLTGLYNRRAFEAAAGRELARVRRGIDARAAGAPPRPGAPHAPAGGRRRAGGRLRGARARAAARRGRRRAATLRLRTAGSSRTAGSTCGSRTSR